MGCVNSSDTHSAGLNKSWSSTLALGQKFLGPVSFPEGQAGERGLA
jgi:hypothetical protein